MVRLEWPWEQRPQNDSNGGRQKVERWSRLEIEVEVGERRQYRRSGVMVRLQVLGDAYGGALAR